MATKLAEPETVSEKLIGQWEQVCEKLVGLAEEIPVSKFRYRPAEGVRTFDEVLRHVGFWNQYVADVALGKKADDSANELPAEKYSTKAQVIEAVRKSGAEAADALRKKSSGLSPETAGMVVAYVGHNSEHYGQLVVYARLNGIVPPASRG